jgi:uncharacterized protein (DUF1778 family)
MATEYISFTADTSVKNLLQNAAREHGVSVSNFIRTAAHRAAAKKLGVEAPKMPRKKAAK